MQGLTPEFHTSLGSAAPGAPGHFVKGSSPCTCFLALLLVSITPFLDILQRWLRAAASGSVTAHRNPPGHLPERMPGDDWEAQSGICRS